MREARERGEDEGVVSEGDAEQQGLLSEERPSLDAPPSGLQSSEPLPSSSSKNEYAKLVSRATSRISSRGIAIGYGAGIALLIILLVPVTALKGSTFSLRLSISLTGLWWMVFTVPAAIWLPGAGATNATTADEGSGVARKGAGTQVLEAWKGLIRMLRPSEMKELPNTFWFLLSWFFLSDGFSTITSTAILFAKTSLHMGATSLMLIAAITPAAGILGAVLWPVAQRKLDMSNLRALVVLVGMAAVIPAYACLGFLPFFKGTDTVETTGLKFGGLTTPGEMYVLAVYFGKWLHLCGLESGSTDLALVGKARYMERSRAMRVRSTRSSYLRARLVDGMGCTRSLTRYERPHGVDLTR